MDKLKAQNLVLPKANPQIKPIRCTIGIEKFEITNFAEFVSTSIDDNFQIKPSTVKLDNSLPLVLNNQSKSGSNIR